METYRPNKIQVFTWNIQHNENTKLFCPTNNYTYDLEKSTSTDFIQLLISELISCYVSKIGAVSRPEIFENFAKKLDDGFNQFHATGLFRYLLKISETFGFLMFSRGIERDQWYEMG